MIKFTAVGDTAIQKRLPKYYDGFQEVKDFIMQGDVRFFNLETTVNRDCYGNFYSGGTWLRTDERVLKDTLEYGFNLTTFANNHCMDFSYNGMLQTLDNLDDVGYVHAGVGRNLTEAASPKYLDTPNGRVALIACSFNFAPGALAGEQSRRLPGRPGVNGIRLNKRIVITEEQSKTIKEIAAQTMINYSNESSRKSGYALPLPEGVVEFGETLFEIGETPDIKTTVNVEDIERLKKYVKEAEFQADYVVVSIHNHTRYRDERDYPADFMVDFCHQLIDAGAHVILGHGPHCIHPLEIYKEKPIFYSLGDFLLQLENCELAPEEFYHKYGLTSSASMYDLFKTRTRDFTCGLQRVPVMMEAIVPYFEMENGKVTKIEIVPVELGLGQKHSQIGWPRIAKNNDILVRFEEMCKRFNTKMVIDDRKATIIL